MGTYSDLSLKTGRNSTQDSPHFQLSRYKDLIKELSIKAGDGLRFSELYSVCQSSANVSASLFKKGTVGRAMQCGMETEPSSEVKSRAPSLLSAIQVFQVL